MIRARGAIVGLGVSLLASTGWPGGNGIGGEGSLILVKGPSGMGISGRVGPVRGIPWTETAVMGSSVLRKGGNGLGDPTMSLAEEAFASTG